MHRADDPANADALVEDTIKIGDADLVEADAPMEPLPQLVIDDGNLPATAQALRERLAATAVFYDRGGPVRIIPNGGPPLVLRMTKDDVVIEAHKLCQPMKITVHGLKKVTLPDRVAGMCLRSMRTGLAALDGITTAPILSDVGSIRSADGYDARTRLWCSDIPTPNLPERPSRYDAEAALMMLRQTFRTFPFGDAVRLPDATPGIEVVDTSRPPDMDELMNPLIFK